ncbi:TonB-dependent receptor domain-containing protein [Chitinophaga sancti]|uniref:Outer membrane beta-barrel protein n=2 Tax=Chitinophaga sancti TaxID=1004 RepID=A0A1K1NEA8_9BACT|nr:TonB-dependent receptor [Chitinophaga sancti]WQG91001.1 outer membrane beta-barrel protein [Chitinophaga sancti]SFW32726.1 Outer membrane receptor for ferrienterochelin and colicins [Chitinophaga sancti]
MHKFVSLCLGMTLSFLTFSYAQQTNPKSPEQGSIQGKLIDEQTNAPIEYASVAIIRAVDSSVVTGMLSKPNGDFSFPQIALGKYFVKVNFIGFTTVYKAIVLSSKNNIIDVGNIKLGTNAKVLAAVEVVGEKPAYTMAIDKRVFNVDKNISSVGGTATDVLKQVPAVSVDIDGNVTVRNGAPTIFVDGRPTTLTMDQIPADAIANIEVITNPSAKYDAEGVSGILNIVLKKNRKAGINGQVNAGASTLGGANGGFDFSIRREKYNLSLSYNIRSRKGSAKEHLFRKNIGTDTTTYLDQYEQGEQSRRFQYGRIGFDWFMDNRNTFTIAGSINAGDFRDDNNLTLYNLNTGKEQVRYGSGMDNSNHNFRNYAGQLGYKHTFAKQGHELTADFNYNYATSDDGSDYSLQYYTLGHVAIDTPTAPAKRYSYGGGNTTYMTGQIDYVNPLSETSKVEAGLRSTSRIFNNTQTTMGLNNASGDYVLDSSLSNNYHYRETINAGYISYSGQLGNFGYMGGMRGEQSFYSGDMTSTAKSNYKISYPISLFPSVFLSQKFKGDHELQLNYTRRVRRPWFRDLLPNLNYTAQSASRGNPTLKPEFTNSFEFSYLKDFNRKHNVMVSMYYRNTQNAITDYSTDTTIMVNGTAQKVVLSYPVNADTRNSYGAEITVRNQLTTNWDVTTNMNMAQTKINASNLANQLTNSGFIFFGKINTNYKLPYRTTLQVTGIYESKQIMAQGERAGKYTVDAAVRKELLKDRSLVVSMGVNDIFNTDRSLSYTHTEFSDQEYYRKRATREARINVSWRFGKIDAGKKKEGKKGGEEQGGNGDF